MAWLAYLIGIVLMTVGYTEGGLIVFLVGMFIHWRFWLLTIPVGLIAFLVGAGWQKPTL